MDRRRNQLLNIGEPGDSGEVVKITDVQTFPLSFWFLCLACLAYYGAIFPFVSLAKDFFRQEFDMDGQEANFITGFRFILKILVAVLRICVHSWSRVSQFVMDGVRLRH
jgi:hypothetical protein